MPLAAPWFTLQKSPKLTSVNSNLFEFLTGCFITTVISILLLTHPVPALFFRLIQSLIRAFNNLVRCGSTLRALSHADADGHLYIFAAIFFAFAATAVFIA